MHVIEAAKILPCNTLHALLQRVAEQAPDAPAILGVQRSPLSHSALLRHVENTVLALNTFGISRGDRVAMLLPNGPEAATCFLASAAAATSAPLNPAYSAAELKFFLQSLAPKAIIVQVQIESPILGVAQSLGISVIRLVPLVSEPAGIFRLESEMQDGVHGAPIFAQPDDIALALHTSGTTSRPKMVPLSQVNLCSSAQNIAASLRLGPQDRCLNIMPLFHIHGLIGAVLSSLYVGASVACSPGFHAVSFFDWMENFNPTWYTAVPTMHQGIAGQAVRKNRTTNSHSALRFIRSCSAALLPKLMHELEGTFQVPVVEAYGMTEASHQMALNPLPPGIRKPGSVGVPTGCEIAIMDDEGAMLPAGTSGRIVIRGMNVMGGYADNPEANRTSFVKGWLDTGDQGRFDSDGYLFLTGRTKEIINRGGEKISPREIDEVLMQHPAVREALAFPIPDHTLGEDVAAGVVLSEQAASTNTEAMEAELQEFVAERLAPFKVPRRIVFLPAIPRGATGKPQRTALSAQFKSEKPQHVSTKGESSSAPRNEIEEWLAAIWKSVLGIDEIGIYDDFFRLGGDSIFGAQVIARVGQKFGVTLPMFRLFRTPNIAGIAEWLDSSLQSGTPDFLQLENLPRPELLPLSFAQQRLWFLAQMEDGSRAYHVHFGMRLSGTLVAAALRQALDRVVERHETLRTTFAWVNGEVVQRVGPATGSHFPMVECDLRNSENAEKELNRLITEGASVPFNLECGPLIRGLLVRQAEHQYALLITMHHIVSDAWSLGLLLNEVSTLYGSFLAGKVDLLPELPVQYADYAIWQRKCVEGELLKQQADYWKTILLGAPELLELPTDYARPSRQEYDGGFIPLELDAELTRALKKLGRRHGVTLFMTLLAGWGALLARLSGQQDVVIGAPAANRGRTDIENLIGFFVNTLALRLDLTGLPHVSELLDRVKAQVIAAQQNQDIPFEQVVEIMRPARSTSRSPFFQVIFTWHNTPPGKLALPGVEAEPMQLEPVTAKFDLTLTLREVEEKIVGGLGYATALFEQATIERHLGYYRMLLQGMAEEEDGIVDHLGILSEREREQILHDWNKTKLDCGKERSIQEIFEEQVRRRPDAVAVVHKDEVLSYGELNRRTNQMGHYLRRLGVRPDSRVAICMERGLGMIEAVLGVLKAGGAYVPLEPRYPQERLHFMILDSQITLVLTERKYQGLFPEKFLHVIDPSEEWRLISRESDTNPQEQTHSENLAYVIYTSGSTGRPKGVMVKHAGLVNLWTGLEQSIYRRHANCKRVAINASLVFDGSVKQFIQILSGRAIVVVPEEMQLNAEALLDYTASQQVDSVAFTPSQLSDVRNAGLFSSKGFKPQAVLLGGEAIDPEAWKQCAQSQHFTVYNVYGPTECTVDSSIAVVLSGDSPHIGRPMANMRIYMLDDHMQLVPAGVTGEIYISGANVARGYSQQPGLTALRFVPDPFATGERMFKTGDLGRWRTDGNIEFLGRNDFQVKVRGLRIELGEIEAALTSHPGVREVVVTAQDDGMRGKRLVAYYRCRDGEKKELGAEQLRAHLSMKLPAHFVPAAYVRMINWPLTTSGKLDRGALPSPGEDAYATREYEAPAGEVEKVLAEIWSGFLQVERVGRQDNFFILGGHSLMAVRVVLQAQQKLRVKAAVADLFAHPVLADFGAVLARSGRPAMPLMIKPTSREEKTALSFAQQRLWFLAQMEGVSEAYHISCRAWLRGELDRKALRRALDRIVERHEALRTSFVAVDGEPEQRIRSAEESRFQLQEEELGEHVDGEGELERIVGEETSRVFDLEKGPLIRGRLVRAGEQEHVLLITMHHIVSDGWSLGVLYQELSVLYGAYKRGEEDPLPALEVQYADYAVWQREWMAGEVLREQGEYWKRTLEGAPGLLEIPSDHERKEQQEYRGGYVELELDRELSGRIKRLSRRHETTVYMVLLGGWGALLGRLAGQQDVVVGTPVANRGWSEIEGLIGFFVNTLAMRMDLRGRPRVSELLGRVKEQVIGGQENQDIPFEQVVEMTRPARSLSHSPIFQTVFAWQGLGGELELEGVEVRPLRKAPITAKFDLTLTLWEREGGEIAGGVTYARSLYERGTIERWVGYYRMLLEGMGEDEDGIVDHLGIMSEREREQILYEWNETEEESGKEKRIEEIFEEQARRQPDAVGVVHEGEALSYGELNRRANRLGHYLRRLGVRPDSRVAICMERGAEMVIGILAILKAGGAYVPLDPAYPRERLLYMLEDSEAVLVLTQSDMRAQVEQASGGVAVMEVGAGCAVEGMGERNLGRELRGSTVEDLAYVIYTSGSSGKPKGVMVPHRGVRRLVIEGGYAKFEAGDGVGFASNPAFDAATMEIWGALLNGGRVVVIGQDVLLDAKGLGEELKREGVSILWLTVGLFNQYVEELKEEFGGLRYLVVGGDALEIGAIRKVLEGRRPEHLLNGYGPTETTTFALTHEIREVGEQSSIPIGKPIGNTQVYILDGEGEPVPQGVRGELYIGGEGVARGYLKRAELTGERFLPDAYRGKYGERMYRTGDLGKWRKDGTVEFLGRNDDQVKVRGYRIELGEIEEVLRGVEGVGEVVVMARKDGAGNKYLAGYYTVESERGEGTGAEQLRAYVAAKLPEYMVPAAYVRMEKMPLTANGKLDRNSLPAPEGDAYALRQYQAPEGETEVGLAAIWAELLHIEKVGRHDNFFELGGHSLLAMQVISRVRKELGGAVTIYDVFAHPTLSLLADRIVTVQLEQFDPSEIGDLLKLVRSS